MKQFVAIVFLGLFGIFSICCSSSTTDVVRVCSYTQECRPAASTYCDGSVEAGDYACESVTTQDCWDAGAQCVDTEPDAGVE